MITEFAEHSLNAAYLKPYTKVLDLGCRNFTFTNAMLAAGVDLVHAVDADDCIVTPDPERIKVYNIAVGVNQNEFIKCGNGTGNHLHRAGTPYPAAFELTYPPVVDLVQLNRIIGIDYWGVVKLDIEGAEYDILNALQAPPARQITVEFHQHTPNRRTEREIHLLIQKLSQWYNITGFELTSRHGAGLNYWDVLFILKQTPLCAP